jgi:hypothetical protein
MGNAQPSNIVSMKHPSRPFDPCNKRLCLTNVLPHVSEAKATTLHQLILLQDWQRVLIRAKLFPSELKKYSNFQVNANQSVRVLPLHLACALDPPVLVVELLLELYVDASAMPMEPSFSGKISSNRIHQKQWKSVTTTSDFKNSLHPRWKSKNRFGKKIQEWYRNRRGAFPINETMPLNDESHCYLQKDYATEQRDNGKIYLLDADYKHLNASEWDFDNSLIDIEDDLASDDESSVSNSHACESFASSGKGKDIILQLSPSGGLRPLTIDANGTECTSDSSSRSSSDIYRVLWDFQPLFEQVIQHGILLPIHIACFYSASSGVLQALVGVYSEGCLISVGGMLPIHWIAAGWVVPPLLPPPTSKLPFPIHDIRKSCSPVDTLKVLKAALPATVGVKSGNHGMIAEEYIRECMEECLYKKNCLHCLSEDQPHMPPKFTCDDNSISTVESFIFSSDTSSFCCSSVSRRNIELDHFLPCISSLTLARDWDGVLAALKREITLASQWVYGMDEFALSTTPVVWKRLPIHLACAYDAPSNIVSTLLQIYPQGTSMVDPHDGSLPLHIACQHVSPSIGVVKMLLDSYQQATKIANRKGRIPLHVAVLARVPYNVIKILLDADKYSVKVVDSYGKTASEYAQQIEGTTVDVVQLLIEAVTNLTK